MAAQQTGSVRLPAACPAGGRRRRASCGPWSWPALPTASESTWWAVCCTAWRSVAGLDRRLRTLHGPQTLLRACPHRILGCSPLSRQANCLAFVENNGVDSMLHLLFQDEPPPTEARPCATVCHCSLPTAPARALPLLPSATDATAAAPLPTPACSCPLLPSVTVPRAPWALCVQAEARMGGVGIQPRVASLLFNCCSLLTTVLDALWAHTGTCCAMHAACLTPPPCFMPSGPCRSGRAPPSLTSGALPPASVPAPHVWQAAMLSTAGRWRP